MEVNLKLRDIEQQVWIMNENKPARCAIKGVIITLSEEIQYPENGDPVHTGKILKQVRYIVRTGYYKSKTVEEADIFDTKQALLDSL